MKIHYDPKVDVLDITLSEGKVKRTKEIGHNLLLDVDEDDTPVALEVLDASHRYSKKQLEQFDISSLKELKPVVN